MMIAIAIAGSLVVYAWAMGYIDLSTEKSEKAITVHSIANHETDLLVYVQNTGEGAVQLEEGGCLYVNGELVECTISGVTLSDGIATIDEGKTAILTFADGAVPPGEKVEIKVTPRSGGSSEKSDYPAGTATEPPVLDHFTFDTITSPQTSGVSFSITIRAIDQYDKQFTGYIGVNTLTFSGGAISPTTTESFVYGIWSGEVTVTGSATEATITTVSQANSSLTGTSNTFDVVGEASPTVMRTKTYGGNDSDSAEFIVETADGGYLLAGNTQSFATVEPSPIPPSSIPVDIWLVKTDDCGNVQWTQTYGGTDSDYFGWLIETPDGGYAIVGNTHSFSSSGDVWLIKTDQLGNIEWNKTYGGIQLDSCHEVVNTYDGGYIMVGYTWSFGAGRTDCWIVKTDCYGNLEWNRTYGGSSHDFANSLVQTSDEGYMIVGYTESDVPGSYDFWLIKTDPAGIVEWNKTYEGGGSNQANSVIVTSDGEYIVAGTNSFNNGNIDLCLLKFDSSGNMKWKKTYGESGVSVAGSLVVTSDGGYALGGRIDSVGAGDWDYWLIKTDSECEIQWSKTYGGPEYEIGRSVAATSDGGYIMVGYVGVWSDGNSDVWLIKTDAHGNIEWS